MSMRTRFASFQMASTIAPTLLALAALSGWAAEPAPVAELQMADGKVLIAHWEAGPWGRTWANPAMKPLREKFAAWQAEQVAAIGAEPIAFLAATSAIGVTVRPSAEPHAVAVVGSADFGTFAKKLYDKAKAADTDKGTVDAQIPGADESFHSLSPKEAANVLARFGTTLVAAIHAPAVKPAPRSVALTDDVLATVQLMPLIDLIASFVTDDQQKAMLEQSRKQLIVSHAGDATYRLRLVPEGFLERFEVTADQMPGYAAVDQAQLGRLPGNTLMAVGMGFNGKAYWKAQRIQLLTSWAPGLGLDPKDPEAVEQHIDEQMAAAGVTVKLSEIIEGAVGTSLFAITPGMPFPGGTFVFPRSAAIDQLITQGLAKLDTKPPVDGSSVILPIPNMPVAISLACDKGSWLVSSDAIYVDQWLTGEPNGWLDSAAAKVVSAKAPKNAYLIGASDTPAVMRLIAGYAGMALGMAKDLPQDQKQAIMQGINILAQNSSTGYLFAGMENQRYVLETRSITGTVSGFGLFGAAAAGVAMQRQHAMKDVQSEPLQPEVVDNGPVNTLRTVIYPAEIQFQGGTYIDQDGDGVGEYGLLSEISGRRPVATGKIELVEGPLAKSATVDGYSYTIYLPGGVARVADDGKAEPRQAVIKDAEPQESSFVAYSWPSKGKEGMMYAVVADGTVYQAAYAGTPPSWNAVFGGKSWSDAPTWEVVQDGASADGMNGEPAPAPAPTVVP